MSDRFCGIVLAAGAGRRFGGPKALALRPDGTPWVRLAIAALRDGGCGAVVVGVGAQGERAAGLVGPEAVVVPVGDWATGVAATLRATLDAAWESDADAAVVVTVDTPELPAAAVARLVQAAAPRPAAALLRAVYGEAPGHPVVIGRDHREPLRAALSGDVGAGAYLRAHGAVPIDCSDLWSGADVDVRS